MLTRPTCVIRFSMSTSVPLTSGTGDARDMIKEAKRAKMKSARRAIVCVTSKGTKLLAGRGQDTGSRTRNFKGRILGVFYTWSSAVTQIVLEDASNLPGGWTGYGIPNGGPGGAWKHSGMSPTRKGTI